jgi:hypothetical protein
MRKSIPLLILMALLCSASVKADQMAKFKALFLFNFAQNIGWPGEAVSGEFVITIVGDDHIVKELTELAKSRSVGANKLVVKKASSIESIENTHIVYLAPGKCNMLPGLLALKKNEPILIVGGENGLCQKGAGIAFVMSEGRLGFQISPDNIDRNGLKTSSRLIGLGELVQK